MNIRKNFGIYTIGKAINYLIRFLMIPLYSYILTKDEFGRIGLISLITPLITVITGFGFTTTYALKYFKEKEKRDSLFLSILIFTTSIFLLLMVVFNFGYKVIEEKMLLELSKSDYLKLVIIGYVSFLIEYFLEVIRMEDKVLKYMIINTTYTLIMTAFLIFFIAYKKTGIIGYVNGNVLSGLIILTYLLANSKQLKKIKQFKLEKKLLKECLLMSLAIVVGFLFSFALNYADRYIIKDVTKSNADVGVYTMGYKIGELFNSFILTSFLSSASPLLLKEFSESEEKFKCLLKKFFKGFIIISCIYMVLLEIGVKFLFTKIISNVYIDSINVVKVVTLSYIIFGLGQIIGMSILVKEKIKVTTFFSIFSAILNIVLNYLLIPKIGIMGAAISTLIAYFVVFLCFYIYSKRLMDIDFDIASNLKLILLCLLTILLMGCIKLDNVYFETVAKIALLVAIAFSLYKTKFIKEIKSLKDLVRGKNGNS